MIPIQFRAKDLFRLKRVLILINHSNHSPLPEVDTGHPFKALKTSDWEGMEFFNRRLYLLQQGAPLKEILYRSNVMTMEGSVTKKTFEDFGGVATLMSRYETVLREVEAHFRSIPELVGGQDCVVKLVEDEKASKPRNAIGYLQH